MTDFIPLYNHRYKPQRDDIWDNVCDIGLYKCNLIKLSEVKKRWTFQTPSHIPLVWFVGFFCTDDFQEHVMRPAASLNTTQILAHASLPLFFDMQHMPHPLCKASSWVGLNRCWLWTICRRLLSVWVCEEDVSQKWKLQDVFIHTGVFTCAAAEDLLSGPHCHT